ncbi:Delta-1-pyrroline-5-carboxylate dehydrogenase, mitochondrial [Parelaphostrongylus tenuis]|uniref:Delta-1-pyrroline-5-carboxylate dehydrogenase, mitochondrial n=1 Tax=Parelaphostrongylus tenuis TaxID=148309 RepID=A0AAD5QYE2_PARTN|nr:Delta-1-pyrroline-5-carboxylate dehydrogenase, mitochondrial [Parelaphostrongylus tenuis]
MHQAPVRDYERQELYLFILFISHNPFSQLLDHSVYGLTGAIFSEDKDFLYHARDVLRDAVGNMYLNDKSTGSIVGQQPFGGARMSGTNDKAGGPHYGIRWSSPLTIKETTVASY